MKGLKKNVKILKKNGRGKGKEHIDYTLVCRSWPVVNDRTSIFTNLIWSFNILDIIFNFYYKKGISNCKKVYDSIIFFSLLNFATV